ncbi:MAG TPA: hypothetical protein VGM23_03170, partial [Armatimonadota bacterium]
SADAPQDGWQLLLDPGLRLQLTAEWNNNRWGRHLFQNGQNTFETVDVELAKEPVGTITALVPWNDWWDGQTQTRWVFTTPDRGEVLTMASLDPGAWVDPAPPGSSVGWGTPQQREKWLPLLLGPDHQPYVQINAAAGKRAWSLGGAQAGLGHRLDSVKDYAFDWQGDPTVKHPLLYISPEELAAYRNSGLSDAATVKRLLDAAQALPLEGPWGPNAQRLGYALRASVMSGSREVAEKGALVSQALTYLQFAVDSINGTLKPSFAHPFDFMRSAATLGNIYDALADSGLLTPAQRRLLRSQLVYVGYFMDDPETWSPERGYCSGNPNMTVMHTINKGVIACTLPDHPRAPAWAASAIARTEGWLAHDVGPHGEWDEGSHYVNVSTDGLLQFALTARNAKMADFIDDPRLKGLMHYIARQYAPPDPRFQDHRTLIPQMGSGEGWANIGIVAKALAKTDPATSAQLQWVWNAAGRPELFSNNALLGFDDVVVDPRLPAKLPDWGSEVNRNYALFSHGYGTPNEHFLLLLGSDNGMIGGNDTGALFALTAYGKLLAQIFSNAVGYPWSREWPLETRAYSTRRWTERTPTAGADARYLIGQRVQRTEWQTSFLPRQDYLRWTGVLGDPNYQAFSMPKDLPAWPPSPTQAGGATTWTRQILFLRSDAAADVNYYLFRDTMAGGQPTEWTMWTLSEKIGIPAEITDVPAYLADKPGSKVVPTRELPMSDRYTAIGQYDVDMEYFIASPADTPRHTMRWGSSVFGFNAPRGFREYQDMLHLRLPGDGVYYLAFFPHKRGITAPAFSTLSDGKIIKVAGDFGTDYGFLSAVDAQAQAGDVTFSGTAGSVQDRDGEVALSVGAKGAVHYGKYELDSPSAATQRVKDGVMTMEMACNSSGSILAVGAPGQWTVKDPAPGVTLVQRDSGSYALTLPAGVTRVVLVRR